MNALTVEVDRKTLITAMDLLVLVVGREICEYERGKKQGITIGKDIGRAVGWDAAKRDTSKILGTDQ